MDVINLLAMPARHGREALSFDEKYARLLGIVGELESTAVAFSAGVDSTLLLKVALDVLGPERVVAVTGRSASLAREEFEAARRIAAEVGAAHVVLDTDEFENPNYTSNPVNRCYFCKTTLYSHLRRLIAERGIRTMVNGTIVDDLGDHRPGLVAAAEHDVRAPLAEAGFTKADVRELSQRLGLPTFDKPASPCLSSRVPYGEAVTPEKLRMIEAAEAVLHELGFRECRVRHHESLARIEVPVGQQDQLLVPAVAARVEQELRRIGYQFVCIDLRGLRSGSLNDVLRSGTIPAPR